MPNSQDASQPPDDDAFAEIDVPAAGTEVVAHACIAVVGGKDAGRIIPLVYGDAVIGRVPSARIRIDDGAISSQHARIDWDGELHWLTDLGSTNGTFLNGERLEPNKPVSLSFGDSIQLADIVVAYLQSQDEARGQTQQLAIIQPQLPNSTAVRLPDPQLIAQLLNSPGVVGGEPEARAPSLDDQIDKLLKVVAFVRRNWVPLFATTALCALLANVKVFVSPPPTEATMRMRVALKSDSLVDRRPMQRDEIIQFYSAVKQNFENRGLVEETLATLAKGKKPSRDDVALAMGALKLESTALGVFTGVFTHGDPEYAFRFLSQHLKGFLDSEVARTLRGIQAEVDFISGRLKETEAELNRTELELKDFKNKHIDGLPDYSREHFINREALQTRRAELAAQLEKTNLELALARKRLAEEAPMLAQKVENAAPYQVSLIEVRRKLGEAQGRGLGPDHPEVVALKQQEEQFKRLAEEARKTEASVLERGANPGLLDLRRRVGDLDVASRATQAELGQIGGQLGRIDTIFKTMPEVEAKYAQLTRSYSSTKELYNRLFERLRTSQIQLELERSSAKARYEVISAPESSGVPLRKALLLYTAIGIAAGLCLGLVLSLALELRRHLKRRRQVRGSTALVRASDAGRNIRVR